MSFNPFGLFLLISSNLLRNSLWLICMCLFMSHQSVIPLSLNYNFLNVSSILCPRIHFDLPSPVGWQLPFCWSWKRVCRNCFRAEILLTCLVHEVGCTWSEGGGALLVCHCPVLPPTLMIWKSAELQLWLFDGSLGLGLFCPIPAGWHSCHCFALCY